MRTGGCRPRRLSWRLQRVGTSKSSLPVPVAKRSNRRCPCSASSRNGSFEPGARPPQRLPLPPSRPAPYPVQYRVGRLEGVVAAFPPYRATLTHGPRGLQVVLARECGRPMPLRTGITPECRCSLLAPRPGLGSSWDLDAAGSKGPSEIRSEYHLRVLTFSVIAGDDAVAAPRSVFVEPPYADTIPGAWWPNWTWEVAERSSALRVVDLINWKGVP